MKDSKFAIYEMTEEREKKLWKDSDTIVVFDASALLDLYTYSNKTQNSIINDVFQKLKDRLWLPNHVSYEYSKNRKSTIRKLITEKYQPIKDERFRAIEKGLDSINSSFSNMKQETHKDDKHPHFQHSIFEDFEKKLKEIYNAKDTFLESFEEEFEKRKEEIKGYESNDIIKKAVEKHFHVGEEYSFDRIMELIKDGELRYKYHIPPGYKDYDPSFNKKSKEGIQIFGDLIIWKQIIDIAKNEKKNVLFICNDVTKGDWCYTDSRKRIDRPREELIKEIKDEAGVEFWMYTNEQLLHVAQTILGVPIEGSQIQEVKEDFQFKSLKDEHLAFRCDNCHNVTEIDKGELYFDFNMVESHDRKMGLERCYTHEEEFGCSYCDEMINIDFNIWEYPEGVINSRDTHIYGATLIKDIHYNLDSYNEQQILDEEFLGDEQMMKAVAHGRQNFEVEQDIEIEQHTNFNLTVKLNHVEQEFVVYVSFLTDKGEQKWLGFGNVKTMANSFPSEHVFRIGLPGDAIYFLHKEILEAVENSSLEIEGKPIKINKIRFRSDSEKRIPLNFYYKFGNEPIAPTQIFN